MKNIFSLLILSFVLSCNTTDKESKSLSDLKTKKGWAYRTDGPHWDRTKRC